MKGHAKLSLGSMFVIAMGAATLLLHPTGARSAEAACSASSCGDEVGCTYCDCTEANGWTTCRYACAGASCGGSGGGGTKPGGE